MVDEPGDAPETTSAPYGAGGAIPTQYAVSKESEALDVRGSMHLGSLRRPTTRSILLTRIEGIKHQLKAHEDALAQLDSQPETEKLLDSLRKLDI